MLKAHWIFKSGWFLGLLAIIYQIIILMGIGDYPPFSDVVFTTGIQKVAYFVSGILGIFLLALTTIAYFIGRSRRQAAAK